jgi:hypothetical protein
MLPLPGYRKWFLTRLMFVHASFESQSRQRAVSKDGQLPRAFSPSLPLGIERSPLGVIPATSTTSSTSDA